MNPRERSVSRSITLYFLYSEFIIFIYYEIRPIITKNDISFGGVIFMDFVNEIVELNEKNINDIINTKLQNNEDPLKIMDDIREAMKIIGDKYSSKEYFLPELIILFYLTNFV